MEHDQRDIENEPTRRPGGDDAPDAPGVVPAGRAGADSGAVPLVEIDEDSEAGIPDVGSQNDIPGVGPRGGADGPPETRRSRRRREEHGREEHGGDAAAHPSGTR